MYLSIWIYSEYRDLRMKSKDIVGIYIYSGNAIWIEWDIFIMGYIATGI